MNKTLSNEEMEKAKKGIAVSQLMVWLIAKATEKDPPQTTASALQNVYMAMYWVQAAHQWAVRLKLLKKGHTVFPSLYKRFVDPPKFPSGGILVPESERVEYPLIQEPTFDQPTTKFTCQ